MSTNFGVGTRDMAAAGHIFLKKAFENGEIGATSLGHLSKRWTVFAKFVRTLGIKKLENVTRDMVVAYGKTLNARVRVGEIGAGHAQDLLSAVNSVMHKTPAPWQTVGAVRVCGMAQRHHIRTLIPAGLDPERYRNALAQLEAQNNPAGAAVARLARDLGLRSREASLFDAKRALHEAERTGSVTVTRGTKGGLARVVPITHPDQLDTLRSAVQAQGNRRNLIPQDRSWKTWCDGTLRATRETVQDHTGAGLHNLRASFACQRYKSLTGHDAPVVAGRMIASRAVDYAARLRISAELGHGRIDVVASYIGGRS